MTLSAPDIAYSIFHIPYSIFHISQPHTLHSQPTRLHPFSTPIPPQYSVLHVQNATLDQIPPLSIPFYPPPTTLLIPHAFPVKSISSSPSVPSPAFSHVQLLLSRNPHAHVSPAGFTFSSAARSHVHSPAGRARQEHRAPATVFSVVELAHVHWSADCWPHEQVALEAQRQESERLQQVGGLVILDVGWGVEDGGLRGVWW